MLKNIFQWSVVSVSIRLVLMPILRTSDSPNKLPIPAINYLYLLYPYSVHHTYFNDVITLFWQQDPKVLSSIIRKDVVGTGRFAVVWWCSLMQASLLNLLTFHKIPQANDAWINGADAKKKSHKSCSQILHIVDASPGERNLSEHCNWQDRFSWHFTLNHLYAFSVYLSNRKRKLGQSPERPPWRRPVRQWGQWSEMLR